MQTDLASTLLLAGSLLVTGCGAKPATDTAEDSIRYTLDRLADESDPSVVWEMLPTSYHADIQGWCKKLAEELPGKAYDKLFAAIREAGITLKMKAEDLLSFAPVQGASQMLGGVGEDELIALFTALGDIQILLGDSDLATLEKLKTLDLAKLLRETGARIWGKAEIAYRVTGRNPATVIGEMRYQTISQSATNAELAITIDGSTKNIQFTKIEDRWLPRDLVESWLDVRTNVEAFFADLAKPETKKKVAEFEKQLDEVLAGLKTLQATEGRTQFANALQKMMGKLGENAKNLLPAMMPKGPR